jgi:hypothetical protein
LVDMPGGLTLLDTGSPVSIEAPGFLTEYIGEEVARLMGMDELQGRLLIDGLRRRVTFGAPAAAGHRTQLRRGPGGLPLVRVRIGARHAQAVLDTGAQLSYAPADVVAGGSAPERRRDFLPGFGTFETDTAILPVRVGTWVVPLRCGVLPPMIAGMLGLMDLEPWIVGSELFLGRSVQLDMDAGTLTLLERAAARTAGAEADQPPASDDAHDSVPLGGMGRAYAAAGSLLQAQLSDKDHELLGQLRPDDVLVVSGCYDHVETVLARVGIPHEIIAPQDVATRRMRPEQLLVVNCPGHLPDPAIPRVRDFVARGGTLFTTDWALSHVLERAFPGRLSRLSDRNTVDEVVQVDGVHGNHPLLTDFSHAGSEPVWWLEGSSYPIRVDDPAGVEILLSSAELEQRYGSGVVAARFTHEAGEVIHMISHYYLQRAECRSERHRRSGGSYAEELGLGSVLRNNRQMFRGVSTVEVEAAHKAMRFMSNVVLEKRRKLGGVASSAD